MKYGYLKGHKVAECQNSQTQLMARFLKEGVVDEWHDAEAKAAPAKKKLVIRQMTQQQQLKRAKRHPCVNSYHDTAGSA